MRAWPEYRNCGDVVSHLAFCNYLREFFGPEYSSRTAPLREFLKKGADFAHYSDGSDLAKKAQAARAWLLDCTLQHCILEVPDWEAAAYPWSSGRPFELFLDASDISWCAALVQRDKPAGTPRLIAFVCKSFSDEATRWSAFEREYFCYREGYAAVEKWVMGFTVFCYFDHKNIARAESVLASRRAAK